VRPGLSRHGWSGCHAKVIGRAARRYGNAVSNTTRRPSRAAARPEAASAGKGTSTTPAETQSTDEEPLAEAQDGTQPRPDPPVSAEASPPHRPGRRLLDRFARWWDTPGAFDTAVCLVYAAFAFWLTAGLWPHPATRAIAVNPQDQALIEWFLAHGVQIWQGDFSLVSDRLNVPDGINLMTNASILMHATIMAPVTALFGAAVSFALLVALNLAATAAGWYLLLARGMGLRRGAALVGGVFAGFAPGMISQSNSHLHMSAQWLVPAVFWFVIRLTRVTTTRAVITSGAAIGVLLSIQLLLGEEVLFLTALTITIFSIVYALTRLGWAAQVAPRVFAGLGVGALVALPLVAYPLYTQFYGPMHTPNAPFSPAAFYSDLASFTPFSPLSIAGTPAVGSLSTGPTEYNAYLGLPVLLLVGLCLLWGLFVWRRNVPALVAIGVTGALMAYLSLGPYVTLNGVRTGWPSLYNQIADLPVINSALPTRYALALIPLIGALLAYTLDSTAEAGGAIQAAGVVLVVAALVPTMPAPVPTIARDPVPEFISSGAWRQCAPDGGVIVPVPVPTPQEPDLMRWPTAANLAFGIPEGFFIGPYGQDGRSSIGVYPRQTSLLLADVYKTGNVPAVTDDQRNQARTDLAYWKANCVALAHVRNEAPLRATLEQLLGPGTAIKDTWTWKVG
jgi:hypothetical protein